MKSSMCFVCILLLCTLLHSTFASPVGSSDTLPNESEAGLTNLVLTEPVEDLEDRDKREVGLKVAAGFGVKNFLLDLIFGKVNQVIDYKTKLVTQFDRTNRYKNYYLLNLGTDPTKGGGGSTSGQVSGRSDSSAAGGYPNAGAGLGALTSLLGSLNPGSG